MKNWRHVLLKWQVKLLKEKLARMPDLNGSRLKVKVATVDGFQGSECDIIILSCVRSHSHSMRGKWNNASLIITFHTNFTSQHQQYPRLAAAGLDWLSEWLPSSKRGANPGKILSLDSRECWGTGSIISLEKIDATHAQSRSTAPYRPVSGLICSGLICTMATSAGRRAAGAW